MGKFVNERETSRLSFYEVALQVSLSVHFGYFKIKVIALRRTSISCQDWFLEFSPHYHIFRYLTT